MRQATAPKLLHIFKPGRHVTVAGEAIEFSETDLQATARAYDPKKHKAPLVKGHPAVDKPAHGWAGALSATERGLFAAPEKVEPEFAEEVRAGRWGKVSAKFYRPTDANNPVPGVWYLRHVGFLGAQPPAVKGLDEPEFAEDDGCVCFSEPLEVAFGEWTAMTNATLWRQLREFLVAKFGMEDADRVIPNYSVRDIEIDAAEEINRNQAARGQAPAFGEGGEPSADTNSNPNPQQEHSVTEQEAARLREENAAQQRQIEDLQAAQATQRQKEVLADNTAFAEGLAREARIPAAMVAQVAAIGAQLQATPDVAFGEGDARMPLHGVFRELLSALPKQVEFSEQATRDRAAGAGADDIDVDPAFAEGAAPERLEQHRKALKYAKEHNVSYAVAAAAVIK